MTQQLLAPVPVAARVQRVAHFTDTYLPRRDGVVTSLRTLCDALTADGCETVTVAPRHRSQDRCPELLTLGSVPCGVADLRLGGWPRRAHLERFAAWRPDLIHVHTPGPMGLLGTIAARRLGLPLVHSYHTDLYAYADAYRIPARAIELGLSWYANRIGVEPPGPDPARSRRHAAIDGLNRLLLGDAAAVIVPTPAVLARGGLPVPDERIFLVPAGVAPRTPSAGDVAEFRRRHSIHDGPVVLFVGRVNREKGVDLLVEAFASVVRTVPDAQLVLIGAVYERRWLTGLLHSTGIAGRVVVTGQLPPDEVAAAYALADVFAFPSRTDTQGLVLQEAALAGVPSVLADAQLHRTGALGGATRLAEPTAEAYGRALADLLTDPAAARRLGAAARERALAHTPARYAAAMRDVYDRATVCA
ncbi:MAG: glycosyltransferase [Hamadaea sp.]|nr:glycosyltransferase [Hamadaea sp.]